MLAAVLSKVPELTVVFCIATAGSAVAMVLYGTHYLFYPSKSEKGGGLVKRNLKTSVFLLILRRDGVPYYRMEDGYEKYVDGTLLRAYLWRGFVVSILGAFSLYVGLLVITVILQTAFGAHMTANRTATVLAVGCFAILTLVEPELFTRYGGLRARVTDFICDLDMPFTPVLWGGCVAFYLCIGLARLQGVPPASLPFADALENADILSRVGYFGLPLLVYVFVRDLTLSALGSAVWNVKIAFWESWIVYLLLAYSVARWSSSA